MIFRIFELYSQGKELKSDPIGFGSGLGKDAIAPLFIVPAVILAILSLVSLYVWWLVGWGVFLFVSVLFAIGIITVHILNVLTSKVFARAEVYGRKGYEVVRDQVTSNFSQNQKSSTIIDTTIHE